MDSLSIWQTEKLPPFLQEEEEGPSPEKRYEVAVIGGGICGLLIAYRLLEKGVSRLAIIDAGGIAEGVTAHTTAKITSQHGLIYDRLLTGLGREKAWQYAQANQTAVEEYARLTDRFPCGFERCGGVVYATDEKNARTVERELEAALRLGLPAAPFREEALPFPITTGVRFSNQARFHPLQFVYGLADHLHSCGVDFFLHAPVVPDKNDRNGMIRTLKGDVRADTAVVATHFPYMDKPGFYFARIWQERSYVVALKNTGSNLKDMYWGAGETGYSLRPAGEWLLVGGGSHKVGHEGQKTHFDRLSAAGKAWYPEGEVVAQWSAQDCMTHDGIPYIGRYKQLDGKIAPRVFVATGFNKWGMTSSMVAADILSNAIVEGDNPWEEVFSPSRFDPGMKAKQFLIENADMLVNYIGGYMEIPADTAASLHPGEGRILSIDGERVGAYKATDGTIYTVNPVCTHMGCILEWNQDECSWDCPCHGSRYDVMGRILNNPAPHPLSKGREPERDA